MEPLRLKTDLKIEQGWVEYLKKIDLFTDVKENPTALTELSALMGELFFESGEKIISEGERGTELFLLIEGKASVYKATVEGELYKVVELESSPPVPFGEGGLLESDSRSATIKAETRCHCLILKQADFERFCKQYPDWALPILRRIAQGVLSRLKKTNEDLSLLYHALVAEVRGG